MNLPLITSPWNDCVLCLSPSTIFIFTVMLSPGLNSSKSKTFSIDNDYSKKEPVYTKPRLFMGAEVPNVLLSGDHSKIDQWKKDNRF